MVLPHGSLRRCQRFRGLAVNRRLKHFMILWGLGIYIVASSLGIAGKIYSGVDAYDVKFTISLSVMLAIFIGLLVWFALYNTLSEDLQYSAKEVSGLFARIDLMLVLGPAAAAAT